MDYYVFTLYKVDHRQNIDVGMIIYYCILKILESYTFLPINPSEPLFKYKKIIKPNIEWMGDYP